MAEYLTHSEYQSYGGELDVTAFRRLSMRATALIDQRTFGRLKDDTTFSDRVKMLVFELVGLFGNADVSGSGYSGQVASESNDGYSLTFASGSTLTLEAVGKIAADLIEQYLEGELNEAGESLLCRWA